METISGLARTMFHLVSLVLVLFFLAGACVCLHEKGPAAFCGTRVKESLGGRRDDSHRRSAKTGAFPPRRHRRPRFTNGSGIKNTRTEQIPDPKASNRVKRDEEGTIALVKQCENQNATHSHKDKEGWNVNNRLGLPTFRQSNNATNTFSTRSQVLKQIGEYGPEREATTCDLFDRFISSCSS